MINLTCCIAVTAANPKPQMALRPPSTNISSAEGQSPRPKTTHAMKAADVVKASVAGRRAMRRDFGERHHPEQCEYGGLQLRQAVR